MKIRAENVQEESGQTDGVYFVSPFEGNVYAATDTPARDVTSNVPAMKSAKTTAEAVTVIVPLNLPLARTATSRGAKITSVELYYKVGSAACTAVSLAVYKVTLAADGTALSAAEVAGAKDLADDDCIDADEHTITWTPTTPAFIGDNEFWYAVLSLTKATGTDLYWYGALINFTRAL